MGKPFHCWSHFGPKHKDAKISHCTLRWVHMCHWVSVIFSFLHHFVLAKSATSSVRVNIAGLYQKQLIAIQEVAGAWPEYPSINPAVFSRKRYRKLSVVFATLTFHRHLQINWLKSVLYLILWLASVLRRIFLTHSCLIRSIRQVSSRSLMIFNPSNAKATFVQSTRTQRLKKKTTS